MVRATLFYFGRLHHNQVSQWLFSPNCAMVSSATALAWTVPCNATCSSTAGLLHPMLPVP